MSPVLQLRMLTVMSRASLLTLMECVARDTSMGCSPESANGGDDVERARVEATEAAERRQRWSIKHQLEQSALAPRHEWVDRLPQGQLFALQRDAGNHAVTRLLSRAPVDLDPGRFFEKHPEMVEGKKKDKQGPEYATRSDATSYESQPEALREIIERSQGELASSWFSRLSDEARSNLVHMYNRMLVYGVWGHVRVIKSVEAGERPVNLGLLKLHVAGKSQSVVFEIYDGKALREALIHSGHFGKDTGPFGVFHSGQTSMREWRMETVDGLHLSIGMGTEADAHIDKRSPTNRPKGAIGQFDFVRSVEHHWQELWPEFGRNIPGWLMRVPQHVYEWLVDKLKFLGAGERFRAALKSIPEAFFNAAAYAVGILDAAWAGTTFKPADKIEHLDPSQRERDTDFVVVKEYRFGGKGKGASPPALAPVAQVAMDAELREAVSRAVYAADPGVVRPTGRDKRDQDDYADAPMVGLAMAGKILHQARARGVAIELDLGALYYDLATAEIMQVKQQLTTIGRTAREALAVALTARKEGELANAVLGVRSGTTQLGRSPVRFPLH